MDFGHVIYETCRLGLLKPTSPKGTIQKTRSCEFAEMNRSRSCSVIICELHYALDDCSSREVEEITLGVHAYSLTSHQVFKDSSQRLASAFLTMYCENIDVYEAKSSISSLRRCLTTNTFP